jgi:hypothetical protein
MSLTLRHIPAVVVETTAPRVERQDPRWLRTWGGYVDGGLWALVVDGTLLVWTVGRLVLLVSVSPIAWVGHRCTAALRYVQPEEDR